MEVGAVKQAFNNEIIQLKKKLNQAKIQVIHKLTRKAKTLAEKKAPEQLEEKLKRKAASAVNEVLIIKKIKARDIAKFAITHTGKLDDYLNKPKVDNDKGCARLLLHKALQDKYKSIRNRFSGVPIKDLFMSRQERRKIKKEARDNKKNKNKKKNKVQAVNSEGDWNVEDVELADITCVSDGERENSQKENDDDSEENASNDGSIIKEEEFGKSFDKSIDKNDNQDLTDEEDSKNPSESENEQNSEEEIEAVGKFVKSPENRKPIIDPNIKTVVSSNIKIKSMNEIKKKPGNKIKLKDTNKNKNLNEKLLQRKFKKDTKESMISALKVVDPFFKTSTGENYMSLAEPRLPDEVKDEHKQGNRKLRRAVMFGNVSNIKPKRDNYRPDDQRQDNRFNRQNGFEKGTSENRFKGKSDNNDRARKFNDNRSNFKDRQRNDQDVSKPEKLHPSWEAKKLKSGIKPFTGKKIVFDES